MCEFKVLLKDGNDFREVASDVVYVGLHGNTLTLQDVIGQKIQFQSTIITEVNVPKETLKLYLNPLIGKVLNFIGKYDECVKSNTYSEDLEEIWEEVKADGLKMIRALWVKLKGE